jgi:hypothetical protein
MVNVTVPEVHDGMFTHASPEYPNGESTAGSKLRVAVPSPPVLLQAGKQLKCSSVPRLVETVNG